jgi:hypothetical protein
MENCIQICHQIMSSSVWYSWVNSILFLFFPPLVDYRGQWSPKNDRMEETWDPAGQKEPKFPLSHTESWCNKKENVIDLSQWDNCLL